MFRKKSINLVCDFCKTKVGKVDYKITKKALVGVKMNVTCQKCELENRLKN